VSLPRPPGTAPDPEQRRLAVIRNALAQLFGALTMSSYTAGERDGEVLTATAALATFYQAETGRDLVNDLLERQVGSGGGATTAWFVAQHDRLTARYAALQEGGDLCYVARLMRPGVEVEP